jgi:hypothetical protein
MITALIITTVFIVLLSFLTITWAFASLIKIKPHVVIKKEVQFIPPEEVDHDPIYELDHIKKAIDRLPDPNFYRHNYFRVSVEPIHGHTKKWITIKDLLFDKMIDRDESNKQRRPCLKWVLRNRFKIV